MVTGERVTAGEQDRRKRQSKVLANSKEAPTCAGESELVSVGCGMDSDRQDGIGQAGRAGCRYRATRPKGLVVECHLYTHEVPME